MKALEIKNKLIDLGCKEWKKADMHRIYIDGVDAKMLFNNEHASFGKKHTVFFDVVNGCFNCSDKSIKSNLNSMISE